MQIVVWLPSVEDIEDVPAPLVAVMDVIVVPVTPPIMVGRRRSAGESIPRLPRLCVGPVIRKRFDRGLHQFFEFAAVEPDTAAGWADVELDT